MKNKLALLLVAFGFPLFLTQAIAGTITSDCPSFAVHGYCTGSELASGDFFFVNEVFFHNFEIQTGGLNFTVTPTKTDNGNGGDLHVGFMLDFNPTLSVATKGSLVEFDLTYDVTPGASKLGFLDTTLTMGSQNGHGDFVTNSLYTSGQPGPDINISCIDVSSCSGKTINGLSWFASPSSTGFNVGNLVSILIDNGTGGIPFAEIQGFSNSFYVVPEPDLLSLLTIGFIPLIGFRRLRR